ncbi:hypothetical protein LguiB_023638 [Lonicera macranthoides]
MDMSYSFVQPNAIRGVEGTRYRILDPLNLYTSFNSKFIGCPGLVSIASPTKKLKKIFVSSTRIINSRILTKGALNSSLCRYNTPNTSACASGCSFKTLRGVVQPKCQGNDSVAYIDCNDVIDSDNEENLRVGHNAVPAKDELGKEVREEEEVEAPSLDDLRELLQKSRKELEVAKLNSSMFEEKAHRISVAAIALKDEAVNARNDVDSTLNAIQEIVNEETVAKEAILKATEALSLAEARLQVVIDSLEVANERSISSEVSVESVSEYETTKEESNPLREEEEEFLAAQNDIKECQANLENCRGEVMRLQSTKEELQKKLDRLKGVAEKAQMSALKADDDVANIMFLAEQAVAFELGATHRVNDVEVALQKAEKKFRVSPVDNSGSITSRNGSSSHVQVAIEETLIEDKDSQGNRVDIIVEREKDEPSDNVSLIGEPLLDSQLDIPNSRFSDESDQENGKLGVPLKDTEVEVEKSKNVVQTKKLETQKDWTRDGSPLNAPKALLKKSSRFFSASFFSFAGDGTEFTPGSVFRGLMESARKELPKLVVGSLLVGTGIAFYANQAERVNQLFQQPDIITTSIDEVSSTAKPLINEEEASLFDMVWLLLGSVIFVPLFQKIPGGSPVLGYLTAGILIGPYGLSIIHNVHGTKAIAEFGVVFLLFNIGLELSVERLSSMKKYVFGLGSAQVLVTAVVVGLVAHFVSGQLGPAALVIGNGLALSSTAVVLQVLQERGESTSRHGRATFSVLLFQDLAVVVLLILIPLISPNSSKGGIGFQAIAEALGLAAVKAIVAISAIIAGGRLLLRPIYKQIAENQNAEIFSANTLLVILGTSLLTARAGLSMALGAFLAGLLLAETEFSLQVESDIAPYRGLLLGLFFMTVGMSIDPKLLISNFPVIMGTLGLLIVGKTLLVAVVGKLFGISSISAIRVGLLLAPGGEFAFVAFGDAVNQGIMSPQLSSLLFLVVGISMALTPWLAAGGQFLASRFEVHDVRSLLPAESEVKCLAQVYISNKEFLLVLSMV